MDRMIVLHLEKKTRVSFCLLFSLNSTIQGKRMRERRKNKSKDVFQNIFPKRKRVKN